MSRDFSQTLPFAPSSSRALALLLSLSCSRARLLPGRITYNYLKTRLHGAWERLSTLVMPSQSRVHIGPLETSSKTWRRGEMLMRPGRRGRKRGEGQAGCLIVSFFVGIGASQAAYLAARRIWDTLAVSIFSVRSRPIDRTGLSMDGRWTGIVFQECEKCWFGLTRPTFCMLYMRDEMNRDRNFRCRDGEMFVYTVG